MPATPITDILRQVRTVLVETKPKFWSDEELTDILKLGVNDLWGAILDLHQDHYLRVDSSHVVLKAGADRLSGVPEDCFRVQLIEPRVTGVNGSGRQILFTPRKYKHPDFVSARASDAIDPSSRGEVFYQLTGAGSPVSPPVILTAPTLSADLDIRIVYNPTIEVQQVNPIPGMSDNALKMWTIAYAIGKEREDRQPDPAYLQIYATEKQLILTRLTPRQEQEEEVVEDFFQGFGHV